MAKHDWILYAVGGIAVLAVVAYRVLIPEPDRTLLVMKFTQPSRFNLIHDQCHQYCGEQKTLFCVDECMGKAVL